MNTLRSYYHAYLALRLPWRRKFLVGTDLHGNTYWEFRDQLNAKRMRRIRKQKRGVHVGDVSVSPQWHQWLRHARDAPPSLQEQQTDVARQIQLRHNAMLADQRWAAKKKYIEPPTGPQKMGGDSMPEPQKGDETIFGGDAPKTEPEEKMGVRNAVESPPGAPKNDPWERERVRQERESGEWQPQSWSPGVAKR